MHEYLRWWFVGGGGGIVAGLLVLRYRGALTWRAPLVYAAATLGCLYGAKVQYQLRFMPVLDALAVSPAELLQPGFHIPLGLACALVAAIGACILLRAPLLQLGDALAMTGAVMMPIGRIGCLVAGCCRGVQCPAWLDVLCALESDGGQHVHVLPAYYAAVGVGTALLHVYLLRRRVTPGTLLAVGLAVYPLGHLAVEQLRDDAGNRALVMTPVLLAMIALDLLAIVAVTVARRLATLNAHSAGESRNEFETNGGLRPLA